MQCFETEGLLHQARVVLPVLMYLFHRLESRFTGKPTLLILDEAWVYLDNPAFAARIREWLKVLRKKNVSVVFATQSLADIANSTIAPAIIESCPQRIFLPNERAVEPQSKGFYEQFGLNDRQMELVARAVPKRQYYLQSRRGNRLFELGLGPIALAFCGASSPADQLLIDRVLAEGQSEFARRFLAARGLNWAAALLGSDNFWRPPNETLSRSASGRRLGHHARSSACPGAVDGIRSAKLRTEFCSKHRGRCSKSTIRFSRCRTKP